MKISIQYIIIVFLSIFTFSSCENTIDRPEQWPDWANISQPKIENAKLTGLNNESSINAGQSFKFTALISDIYNDLVSLNLSISINNREVFQKEVPLTGKESDINIQGYLPFIANFTGPVVPVVKLNALNNEVGGKTEMTLSQADNITVNRPQTPDKLYVVDNLGQVFELFPIEGLEYDFITKTDLSAFGQSFKIAEKLTGDNKIDYTGLVWGTKDGEIISIGDESGSPIPISSPEGIEKIAFNTYSFIVSGAAPAIIIDKEFFAASTYVGYKSLNLSLSKGDELEFVGFGDDVSGILRPDYFINISGNKANFDGYAGEYTLQYNESNGFIYIENQIMTLPDALWMDGTGLGFPQPPYIATSVWGWGKPADYIFCKKTAEGVFEAIVYISQGFGFKFFTRRGWESPEYPEYKAHNFTVTPSELIQSHKWTPETWDGDGNLIPGSTFTPGVYKIEINVNEDAKTIKLIAFN